MPALFTADDSMELCDNCELIGNGELFHNGKLLDNAIIREAHRKKNKVTLSDVMLLRYELHDNGELP